MNYHEFCLALNSAANLKYSRHWRVQTYGKTGSPIDLLILHIDKLLKSFLSKGNLVAIMRILEPLSDAKLVCEF